MSPNFFPVQSSYIYQDIWLVSLARHMKQGGIYPGFVTEINKRIFYQIDSLRWLFENSELHYPFGIFIPEGKVMRQAARDAFESIVEDYLSCFDVIIPNLSDDYRLFISVCGGKISEFNYVEALNKWLDEAFDQDDIAKSYRPALAFYIHSYMNKHNQNESKSWMLQSYFSIWEYIYDYKIKYTNLATEPLCNRIWEILEDEQTQGHVHEYFEREHGIWYCSCGTAIEPGYI